MIVEDLLTRVPELLGVAPGEDLLVHGDEHVLGELAAGALRSEP